MNASEFGTRICYCTKLNRSRLLVFDRSAFPMHVATRFCSAQCTHQAKTQTACFSWAPRSAIFASSSATAGVLAAAVATSELAETSSVTHPPLAVATFWMYLKRVPCDARRGGGDHAFCLASHSSSEIKRSIVLASGRACVGTDKCEKQASLNRWKVETSG